MAGTRNKTAGSNWELEVIKRLKEIGFPHVVSTRAENRNLDAAKVDIMNSNERENGRLPFDIQCKTTASTFNYQTFFADPVNKADVILHRQTRKSKKNFIKTGEYAISKADLFFSMVKRIKDLENQLSRVLKERYAGE